MNLHKKALRYIVNKSLYYYNKNRKWPTNHNLFLERIYYYTRFNQMPDFKNPTSLNEYICHQKFFGDFEKMALVSDKFRVRKMVKKLAGEKYLLELYDVVNTPNEITKEKYDSYPLKFVAKPNHASGRVYINKLKDYEAFQRGTSHFMREFGNTKNELHYKHIKPKLIIEEYIEPKEGGLYDLKFYVFKGKVQYILAGRDIWPRKESDKRRVYDRNWETAWFQRSDNLAKFIKKPNNMHEMIDLAEILAKGWDFIRVDLYYYDGKIKFGELTSTPNSGRKKFKPIKAEKDLFTDFLA